MTTDQTKLASICSNIENCPGCTQAACEMAVAQALTAIERTWKANIFGRPIGNNTCERWAFEYEKQLGKALSRNACVKSHNVNSWEIPGGVFSPRHAAYEIEFCNGKTVYFDNTAIGKGDHIFFPEDVPEGW